MKSPNLTRRATYICIFILVFDTVLGYFSRKFSINKYMNDSLYVLLLSAVHALLLLLAARYLTVRTKTKKEKTSLSNITGRRFRVGWLPVTLFAGLTAALGGILLNAAMSWIPFSGGLSGGFSEFYFNKSIPLLFVSVALLPALTEEIFFRGAVLTAYQNRSYGAAIIGSASLFALLHASAFNFLAPLFAGIIYALITILFRSVYPAVIAHILNNTLTIFIYIYEERIRSLGLGGYLLFFVLITFLLCCYGALRLADKHLKNLKLSPQNESLSARVKKSAFSPLFSLPFLFLFLLWVAKVILSAAGLL